MSNDVVELLDSDFLWSVLLFFSKEMVRTPSLSSTLTVPSSSLTGTGRAMVRENLTPLTLLNMPSGGIFVFPAAQNAGNCQDVVGNRHVEI